MATCHETANLKVATETNNSFHFMFNLTLYSHSMTPRRSPVKMLDPKKGPVKKSALVKNLPKLEERKRKTNY